jgi:hypothetical protein
LTAHLRTGDATGEIGCLFALVSTVIGFVLGLLGHWLTSGTVNTVYTLARPAVGYLLVVFTADTVGPF